MGDIFVKRQIAEEFLKMSSSQCIEQHNCIKAAADKLAAGVSKTLENKAKLSEWLDATREKYVFWYLGGPFL